MCERKVIENKGKTPGGDELLFLECGHVVCLDDYKSAQLIYSVGEVVWCYYCATGLDT